MKKVLIIFLMLGTLTTIAQNKTVNNIQSKKEFKQNFTPEQKAELLSKRMTLRLDLTDAQQEKVKELFLKFDEDRPAKIENKKEMSSEEKFQLQNNRLNSQIAMKKELKKILSADQFEKWEQMSSERKSHKKTVSKRNMKKVQ
ncbi:hypothetical protein EI546_08580 [Aequorivita sp. H23M31]|uniref:DUF4890 domain-containing protein n=1 Tax=Aequorivita ciconiae TaxID=2494375 RepID=A0A410G3B7_9FLAO|nr:hypothetical protein [Aequorivita sp. H23M31]QAA81772.1 hypothetical protein EI546_08580 [Aequorivita sp. H23M31]